MVVYSVVGAGEVECGEDEALGCLTVWRVLLSGAGDLPSILHLLDEAAQVILYRATLAESHLLWRDELPLCSRVRESGEDQALGQLGQVTCEGGRTRCWACPCRPSGWGRSRPVSTPRELGLHASWC